jgi:hypothetical protein
MCARRISGLAMKLGEFDFDGPFESLDALDRWPGILAVVGLTDGEPIVIDLGGSGTIGDRLRLCQREERWRQIARERSCSLAFFVHFMPGARSADRLEVQRRLRGLYAPACGTA